MIRTSPHRAVSVMALCGLVLALSSGAARAQRAENGRRVYQEQLRVELDRQQAAAREIGLDGGGWLSFGLFHYDDATAKTQRTLRQYELRLWASYSVAGVHKFYVRGVVGYDDWNTRDNPSSERGDDFNDPQVERAWYRFDYSRLVRNRTGQDPPAGFTVEVGRNFHEIGTGLVLALPLDAVRITGRVGDWQATALMAKTITDTPNIDDSPAVSTHMDRCFWGGEVRYTGFDRHEPFVYYLCQTDHTSEWDDDPLQQYDYDSSYLGAGSTGSLCLPNLRYSLEFVYQSGRSFPAASTSQRQDIHAMALDVLLEYFFQTRAHPRLSAEYLWGSGDSDRLVSSTATAGGNRPGTDDEAFNAFGFRDTGLAFAPRLSNLHIWQLGLSALPLEDIELFRKMELGTKLHFYAKHKGGGAISDTTATAGSNWVGWEWDVFCNWRLTSDLSMTLRYGAFQPGSAFTDRESRHFIYTGLTYSF